MEIFKAYDIRGTYPDQIDEKLAYRMGKALAMYLNKPQLVVGCDARTSSPAISKNLIEGITDIGVDVVDIGMVSTPCNYFAIGHYDYPGGVMVTASHNPPQYNGFKVSREKVIPVGYESGLKEVEKVLESGEEIPNTPRKGSVSKKDVMADYKQHILNFAKDIKPLKLVIDAGNGLAGKTFPPVFDELPCTVIPLYFEVDGRFPNHEPNPLKEENIIEACQTVKEEHSDFGVAIDADCDRCVFIDENGNPISSDLMTPLIAREILQDEPGTGIVYDLRSSWATVEEIEKAGGKAIRDKVGHAFIKATLRKTGAAMGGELSGHFYFRDNFCADSGIIALIKVLNLLSTTDKTLGQLVSEVKRYFSTGEVNFHVADQDEKIKEIAQEFADGQIDYLDGITVQYADWWFNVRKSNTEPLLRLTLEGKTEELKKKGFQKVLNILGKPV